jgi:hypothetical protein
MTNLVDTYKNLTKLETMVFHIVHDDILDSGTSWTNVGVKTPQEKGALGSLIKKGLIIFEETDNEGFEVYSSALIEGSDSNYKSLV